jgi:hypothetical protein
MLPQSPLRAWLSSIAVPNWPRTRLPTPARADLCQRFGVTAERPSAGESCPWPGPLACRAGDGNRTRTTSLGIVWFQAVMGADLLGCVLVIDHC